MPRSVNNSVPSSSANSSGERQPLLQDQSSQDTAQAERTQLMGDIRNAVSLGDDADAIWERYEDRILRLNAMPGPQITRVVIGRVMSEEQSKIEEARGGSSVSAHTDEGGRVVPRAVALPVGGPQEEDQEQGAHRTTSTASQKSHHEKAAVVAQKSWVHGGFILATLAALAVFGVTDSRDIPPFSPGTIVPDGDDVVTAFNTYARALPGDPSGFEKSLGFYTSGLSNAVTAQENYLVNLYDNGISPWFWVAWTILLIYALLLCCGHPRLSSQQDTSSRESVPDVENPAQSQDSLRQEMNRLVQQCAGMRTELNELKSQAQNLTQGQPSVSDFRTVRMPAPGATELMVEEEGSGNGMVP